MPVHGQTSTFSFPDQFLHMILRYVFVHSNILIHSFVYSSKANLEPLFSLLFIIVSFALFYLFIQVFFHSFIHLVLQLLTYSIPQLISSFEYLFSC